MQVHDPSSHALDRRGLLRAAGALGGLSLLGRQAFASSGATESTRTLVLLQLAGGNDGLSTVVPFGDDAYGRARQEARIGADEVLRLDDYRGLHPSLLRLRQAFGRGELAIVEGVGYPQPNRSHFKSFEIWHTADHAGRAAGEGWIGRACALRHGQQSDPNRVVHVGSTAPWSVRSSAHPPACFSLPAGYRWVGSGGAAPEVATPESEPERGGPSPLDAIRARMHDAERSSLAVRQAVQRYRTPIEYPENNRLAEQLHVAAALIDSGVGVEVISLELSGFDTHDGQRPRHDVLMQTLDGAVGAFLEDLARSQAGRETVLVAFSEFGRRVDENGSAGTDHGKAGPLFVAGAGVRGGLYGAHPALDELDQGDLAWNVDFRRVYATLLRDCFGVDPRAVLGADFATLPLFSS